MVASSIHMAHSTQKMHSGVYGVATEANDT